MIGRGGRSLPQGVVRLDIARTAGFAWASANQSRVGFRRVAHRTGSWLRGGFGTRPAPSQRVRTAPFATEPRRHSNPTIGAIPKEPLRSSQPLRRLRPLRQGRAWSDRNHSASSTRVSSQKSLHDLRVAIRCGPHERRHLLSATAMGIGAVATDATARRRRSLRCSVAGGVSTHYGEGTRNSSAYPVASAVRCRWGRDPRRSQRLGQARPGPPRASVGSIGIGIGSSNAEDAWD